MDCQEWHVILAAGPNHIIIHPIIPVQWPQRQNVPFGISVLKFVAGWMTEDILLPSCTLLILGFGCLSVVAP